MGRPAAGAEAVAVEPPEILSVLKLSLCTFFIIAVGLIIAVSLIIAVGLTIAVDFAGLTPRFNSATRPAIPILDPPVAVLLACPERNGS